MPYVPPPRWQPRMAEAETWPGAPGAWDGCALAAERDTFTARASVEPASDGWGTVRVTTVALEKLGYSVAERRGVSGVRLLLS